MGNESKLHYVKGHCELENGVVQFEGGVRGVSREQVWYNVIYNLRRKYNIDYWINPVLERCETLPSTANHIRRRITNVFKCELIPYANGEIRIFNKLKPKFKDEDILPDFDRMEKEQIDDDSCDADFIKRMSIETTKVVVLEDTITKKLTNCYTSIEGLIFKYSFVSLKFDRKEYLSKCCEFLKEVRALNEQLNAIAETRDCSNCYHKLFKHLESVLRRAKVYMETEKDTERREDMLVCINNLERRKQEYFTHYHESVIDNL